MLSIFPEFLPTPEMILLFVSKINHVDEKTTQIGRIFPNKRYLPRVPQIQIRSGFFVQEYSKESITLGIGKIGGSILSEALTAILYPCFCKV